MKSQNKKELFVEMRIEGRTYRDIAQELSVSKQTLIAWSKELQVEISNGRSMHKDELFKRLALSADHRLEMFSEMMIRIRAEFLSRDLSQISTDRLIEQVCKLNQMVRAEVEAPIFWMRSKKFSSIDEMLEGDIVDEKWPA